MHTFSQYNNEQLIIFLNQNSEAAFNEIYNRFWKLLYTKAYAFLRSDEVAQDCVQNIFIALWKNRQTLKIDNVEHYLHQAVRFQVFNALKQKKIIVKLDERIVEFTNTILQNHNSAYNELKEALNSIISKMPAENREIFLLNREHGLTYKEIADLKKISIKTVEKKMTQALRYLRSSWAKAAVLYLVMRLMS